MKKGVLNIIAIITCCGIVIGISSYSVYSVQKEASEKISEIINNYKEDVVYLITDEGEYIDEKDITAYRMLMLSFGDNDNVESAVFYLCYDRNGEPVYSEFINGLKAGVQTYSLTKDLFGNVLMKANSDNYFYKTLKIKTNGNEIIGLYYGKNNWNFKLANETDQKNLIDNIAYSGESY